MKLRSFLKSIGLLPIAAMAKAVPVTETSTIDPVQVFKYQNSWGRPFLCFIVNGKDTHWHYWKYENDNAQTPNEMLPEGGVYEDRWTALMFPDWGWQIWHGKGEELSLTPWLNPQTAANFPEYRYLLAHYQQVAMISGGYEQPAQHS